MKTRIDDLPIMEQRTVQIDASQYNKIRLGLLRLGAPHRIRLEGMRSLDMLLDQEEWVIVDRDMDDLPVIAWRYFESGKRDALNAPISCTELSFHIYARMVKNQAIEMIAQYMDEHVHEHPQQKLATVSDIPVK